MESSQRGRRRSDRARARLLRALYRPLAEDDERVAYWLRHTRIGVALSAAGGLATLVYALLTPDGPDRGAIVLLAVAVIAGTPAVLLLPLRAMLRDGRGVLMFYAWTVADVAVVGIGAHWDGGERSPLAVLLFLSLAFVTVAYPPAGVGVMGVVTVLTYLGTVCNGSPGAYGWFLAGVMVAFVGTCAMTSLNSWNAYDRQVLLVRAQAELAATDPLTGLLNRRAFLDRVGTGLQQARSGACLVAYVLDLDGFKQVNDTRGHSAGDDVLVDVAAALAMHLRAGDVLARLGGDEFAVLAAVDGPAGAAVLAERVRAAVADAGAPHGVTASIGSTLLRPDDEPEVLLHRADVAMYAAKGRGGDLVDCGADAAA